MNAKLVAGALALTLVTSVHGQAQAQAGPAANPTNSAATTNAAGAAADKTKSFVHFEGADLHMGSLPPITFHGFASQGFLDSSSYDYLGGDTRHGSFEYSEYGLNATMSPFDRTLISAQGFGFDIGDVGKYQPILDYALVDYRFCDQFGIRAGRIQKPQGIYNQIQSVDLARTAVLLPQGVYDPRWRDFDVALDGGSLYGNLSLSKAGNLSYEFYGGISRATMDGGVGREIESDIIGTGLNTLLDIHSAPEIGGQLWWNTPLEGFRVGAALAEFINFDFDVSGNPTVPIAPGHFTALELLQHANFNGLWQQYSLEYQRNKWTFQAESLTQTEQEKFTYHETFPAVPALDNSYAQRVETSSVSWYAGASYEVNKWLQAGTYYNEYYTDINNLSGPPDTHQKDLALSLRFDPTPWWIFKVEEHYIRGTALLEDTQLNPVQRNNGWFMLAVKSTFYF